MADHDISSSTPLVTYFGLPSRVRAALHLSKDGVLYWLLTLYGNVAVSAHIHCFPILWRVSLALLVSVALLVSLALLLSLALLVSYSGQI